MLIYKIFTNAQWDALQTTRRSAGAPVDVADGFVHFSTATQVAVTAAKHFAGQTDLYLIAFDADALGDALKWEVSRGGDLFPHYYGELSLEMPLWAKPLPLENGAHVFPKEML